MSWVGNTVGNDFSPNALTISVSLIKGGKIAK